MFIILGHLIIVYTHLQYIKVIIYIYLLNSDTSLKNATPGNTFPSNNSKLAPPPVDTWDTLSPKPNLLHADAESPPPTIVVAPFDVASPKALTNAFVPSAKFSNSNTPGGPLKTTVFALTIAYI